MDVGYKNRHVSQLARLLPDFIFRLETWLRDRRLVGPRTLATNRHVC